LYRQSRPVEYVYHALVMVGYNENDDSYIVVDPATGSLVRLNNVSETQSLYFYEITGVNETIQ